jgi:hypothetical protein
VSTVIALQSFVGVLENDVIGPSRVEKHSQLGESIIPGPVVKEGRKVDVIKGQLFDSSHPAVKKWPELFGQPETMAHPVVVVEQATAAPGERRTR